MASLEVYNNHVQQQRRCYIGIYFLSTNKKYQIEFFEMAIIAIIAVLAT